MSAPIHKAMLSDTAGVVPGKIIHVGKQDGHLTVWYLAEGSQRYEVVMTGQAPTTEGYDHVGTAVGVDGWLVLHVFAEPTP